VGGVHYEISGLRSKLRVEGDNVGSYRKSRGLAKKIVSARTCAADREAVDAPALRP